MRIEISAPVVIADLPGGLGADLYHLPASTRTIAAGARTSQRTLADGIHDDDWPTVCSLDGLVYAYNGPIRRRRMCGVCRQHAPDELLTADGDYQPVPVEKQHRPGARRLPEITDAQATVLHALYREKEIGVPAVADLVWQKLGYPSARSCANAIHRAFTDRGLEIRPRGQSTIRTPEKRRLLGYGGRRDGERKLTADTVDRLWRLYQAGYGLPTIAARFHARFGYTQRRFHDVIAYAWKSEGRKLRSAREATLAARARVDHHCAGMVKSSDGSKPRPCTQAPLPDSDFCLHHDPRHRLAVLQRARRMEQHRRREPALDFAEIRPHLETLLTPRPDRYGRQLETAAGALARNTGIAPAVCSRLLNGTKTRITVTTANRLLAPVALTVDRIRQPLEEAA